LRCIHHVQNSTFQNEHYSRIALWDRCSFKEIDVNNNSSTWAAPNDDYNYSDFLFGLSGHQSVEFVEVGKVLDALVFRAHLSLFCIERSHVGSFAAGFQQWLHTKYSISV